MDITAFYELKSRLYAAAAAGCAVIGEDFRLKRAVDAFEPLTKVNKVFGRFYFMCCKLLASEDPASEIADCIALADALAVTQGTFADPCETETLVNSCEVVPTNAFYSQLNEFIEKLRKPSVKLRTLTPREYALLKDPRIIAAFIGESSVNSVYLSEFADIMLEVHGKSLAFPLKNSLDLTDPKATGNQIGYIAKVAGSEENDWYMSLANNAENPQNVRIKAISALSCDISNADKLIEIYQTEKGKVKNAALISLAKLSPAQAEPIFKKLTEKYKDSYMEAISESSGEACTQFVRSEIEYCLNNDSSQEKNRPSLYDCIGMLANKKNVEDCFVKIGEYCASNTANDRTYAGNMNNILARDLFLHDEPEYRQMILSLYEKKPDIFFPARFYMEFTENPNCAFDTMREMAEKHSRQAVTFINNIYLHPDGTYRLPCWTSSSDYRAYNTPLFSSIPDNLLEFLCDPAAVDPRYKLKGFMAKLRPAASVRPTSGEMEDMRCKAAKNLMNICRPDDRERVRAYAEKFARAVIDVCPTITAVEILGSSPDAPNDGIIEKYVIYSLTVREKVVISYRFDFFEVPEQLIISELKVLTESLPKLSKKVQRSLINSQLNEVYRALRKRGINYEERKELYVE